MQEIFKKENLKAGMVVEVKTGCKTNFAIVCNCINGLCLSSQNVWYLLENIDNELAYDSDTITKIYGLSRNTSNAYEISTVSRQLLWERKEKPEYMTFWEAMKYKYMKHKNMKEYTNMSLYGKERVLIDFDFLKDLDKKEWLGTNKI